ncbi:MAG: hypothetical protein ACRC62_32285 [Microcoleus sp.]
MNISHLGNLDTNLIFSGTYVTVNYQSGGYGGVTTSNSQRGGHGSTAPTDRNSRTTIN